MKHRSKYNVDNSMLGKLKRTIDGVTFASEDEADRYALLKTLQRSGIIEHLELQPRFEIIAPFTDSSGVKHRGAHYTADFAYTCGDRRIVEEVKGQETVDFVLRMKLFLLRYPEYEYHIIKRENAQWVPR